MRTEVISEIGSNHQGDMPLALKMIQVAAEAGADSVKFQKRDINSYSKEWRDQPYNSENSFGKTYGEHRAALDFDGPQFAEIFECAKFHRIGCFATAFDVASVDFLMELGADRLKIASGSLRDLHLISYAVSTGARVYLSTGGGTLEDVDKAADLLPDGSVLMQATSQYPCPFDRLDLRVITLYRNRYPHLRIGASLHDNGIAMAVAAVTLGAETIEKHITLDRTMKGTDQAFSLEPQGLEKMVRDIRRLEVALGDGDKHLYAEEIPAINKMRGLV